MITETGTSLTAAAAARSTTSAVKLSADFNRFLTMLVTQLRHQDPLNPLNTNEFTQQLVQFAAVEQQIQQNANLERLIALQQQGQAATMAGYLGHSVEIAGNRLPLQGGHAAGSYVLAAPAASVTVEIRNAAGKVVHAFAGETAAGRHDFTWNGEDGGGRQQADGLYTVTVKAVDRAGAPVPADTSVRGRVTGASFENGKTVLLVDDAWVGADEIIALHAAPPPARDGD